MLVLVMAWQGGSADRGGGAGGLAYADTAAVASAGLQDDRSPAVTWSGKRSTQHVGAAYDGSQVSLSGKGSATFTFRGTGAAWVARSGPFDGRAAVSVDGRRTATVDLYARTKQYQQTVYRVQGLTDGRHTLRVARTGTKNRRSTGRNVTVDAFRVLDAQPPSPPTGVVARGVGTSVQVDWAAPVAPDVAGYRVQRVSAGAPAPVVVATTGAAVHELVDGVLATGVQHTYRVQAFDASGNDSAWSVAADVTLPVPAPAPDLRYATCPAATTTVGDVDALRAALDQARPGTVVRLLPGVYAGQVKVTVQGTADAPVWVCGPRSAVLDGGGTTRNGGLRIAGSAHLVVAGLTVQNSQKGVSVLASSAVVLADLHVTRTGEEGVHLKEGTTGSTLVGSTVDHTGLDTPAYGEGVYVGTDHSNWCALTDCAPDRSDGNRIEDNTVSDTAAEPVEVKEGTSGGTVSGNRIDGSGSDARRLIALKGTGWTVSGNVGTDGGGDGVHLLQREGWGTDDVVVGNTFGGDLPGYGVRVDTSGTTNVVGCDNRVPRGARGVSNVSCRP